MFFDGGTILNYRILQIIKNSGFTKSGKVIEKHWIKHQLLKVLNKVFHTYNSKLRG